MVLRIQLIKQERTSFKIHTENNNLQNAMHSLKTILKTISQEKNEEVITVQ